MTRSGTLPAAGRNFTKPHTFLFADQQAIQETCEYCSNFSPLCSWQFSETAEILYLSSANAPFCQSPSRARDFHAKPILHHLQLPASSRTCVTPQIMMASWCGNTNCIKALTWRKGVTVTTFFKSSLLQPIHIRLHVRKKKRTNGRVQKAALKGRKQGGRSSFKSASALSEKT